MGSGALPSISGMGRISLLSFAGWTMMQITMGAWQFRLIALMQEEGWVRTVAVLV